MEKQNLFINHGSQVPYEMNCNAENLRNSYFNPSWENSLDQNDPFESALSSLVSSPVTSNGGGENFVPRELIGRQGSICNSDEISAQSCIGGNNSTNASCYSNPLNSPPTHKISLMDHQMRGNLTISGPHLASYSSFATFAADPGLAERAARYSSFANGQLGGLNDGYLSNGLVSKLDSGKLSRVSSNQSIKICGSQLEVQEKNCCLKDVLMDSDTKLSKISQTNTPENSEFDDSRENGSTTRGEIGTVDRKDANTRKRNSVPKGKTKEPTSSNSVEDDDVAVENSESSAKRNKLDEDNPDEIDGTKAKTEANSPDKSAGDGNQKKNKVPLEPPKDYVHVRARRGQATDAHSLAERARREKISKRMKLLQDLVPGCNKVTGKAVVLDGIINYVQSLQRQVEFLSMKLATIDAGMDFNVEAHQLNEAIYPTGPLNHNVFVTDPSPKAFPHPFQSQQGLNSRSSVNHLSSAMGRNPSIPLLPPDSYAPSQVSQFCQDDLQYVVQLGIPHDRIQNFMA